MQKYILKDSKSKSLIENWFKTSMSSYARDADLNWQDEDALCAQFIKSISGRTSTPAGDLQISGYKTRGRGQGAVEKKLGADGIALVQINTASTELSGFFLFQAKKAHSRRDTLRGSSSECKKMLTHTAASYLLVLLPDNVKMVGAMAVASYISHNDPHLADIPFVSFPRFIVEHLLQGIMIEPLDKSSEMLTPDLKKEILHIISITGGQGKRIKDANEKVTSYLRRLELDISY